MSGEQAQPGRGRQRPDRDATSTADLVGEAISQLRGRHDGRWVEISDRVLDRALRATRRSHLVRLPSSGGDVLVGEQVVVAHLRAAVDDVLADAALLHVHLEVAGRDHLTAVTLSLVGRYGADLVDVADEVRRRAGRALDELHGGRPHEVRLAVREVHVHFEDVVQGDPRTADPWADGPLA